MDVFLLPLLLLCVIGAKIAPKGTLFNQSGLNRDHTSAIRGFLCVLIILDHSSLLTGCGYSAAVLKRVGPYIVAMFYALSAYGLMASYVKNGFSLKDYWKKRLTGTILPYLAACILAIVVRLLLKENLTVKGILLSFVNGHPLVLYSWFILTIIVFYAVFYVAALLAKKDLPLLTALISFALFGFVFAMQKLGFEDFWFNAAWAFPLGILWQQIHPRISEIFGRHPVVYLSIAGAAALWWIVMAEHFFWFGYLARLCATLSVCVFVLLLMFKLKIGNPVLRFWGEISLEIYMGHGLLATALTAFIVPAEQPYLFVAILLIGTFLFAWVFHLAWGGMRKLTARKTKAQT